MFDLNGKNVLVTGASSGIGTEIAKTLHKQGAKVILHGTNKKKLNDVKNILSNNAEVVVANLSSKEEIIKLFNTSIDIFGKVDILINNAGITRDNLLLRMKDEEWENVLDVNLTATMILCREAIKKMLREKWGRIISVSSIVGITGNPGQTNYAASKAGIIGFSKSLAHEVASRGITVNVVAPGFIETKMTEELSQNVKDKILNNIPISRFGKPSEVASLVAFLASEEAGYITGSTFNVNGGMAMI